MAHLVASSGTARYNGPAGRELTITAESSLPPVNPAHGLPAVLTDGTDWYSAEIVYDYKGSTFIAYAVNGYADEATARIDAEARIEEG